MPHRSAAVAFAPLLLVTAVAFAQTPSARPPALEPGVAPTLVHVQGGNAAAHEGAPLRADADARTCLEYLTNTGVIRCAERYRERGVRPPR